MASKLSTCFLSHGCIGLNSKHLNIRFSDVSSRHHRLHSFPFKRNFRQQVNKISPLQPRIFANWHSNGEANVEFESASNDGDSSLREEIIPNNNVANGSCSGGRSCEFKAESRGEGGVVGGSKLGVGNGGGADGHGGYVQWWVRFGFNG